MSPPLTLHSFVYRRVSSSHALRPFARASTACCDGSFPCTLPAGSAGVTAVAARHDGTSHERQSSPGKSTLRVGEGHDNDTHTHTAGPTTTFVRQVTVGDFGSLARTSLPRRSQKEERRSPPVAWGVGGVSVSALGENISGKVGSRSALEGCVLTSHPRCRRLRCVFSLFPTSPW